MHGRACWRMPIAPTARTPSPQPPRSCRNSAARGFVLAGLQSRAETAEVARPGLGQRVDPYSFGREPDGPWSWWARDDAGRCTFSGWTAAATATATRTRRCGCSRRCIPTRRPWTSRSPAAPGAPRSRCRSTGWRGHEHGQAGTREPAVVGRAAARVGPGCRAAPAPTSCAGSRARSSRPITRTRRRNSCSRRWAATGRSASA